MQLSVIIVNYNVKYFLEQCLSSVVNACVNKEAEIFVVDNNSTDGSRDFFEGRFRQVNFIWCNENAGFSRANNLALKRCTGDYILFLNPDTILPEDCLDKCLAFFILQKDAGALGIHMIDGSGNFLRESKRGFPSPLTSLFKLSGLASLFHKSKTFARYYLGHLDENTTHEVDVLAGAFMLVKSNVLDITGGFDERFFMYGEDIDLSYRIKKAGFKNIYFAESTILHFKGESTQTADHRYIRLFYGAMGLFVKKHYTGGLAVIYNLVLQITIWFTAMIAGLVYMLRGMRIKKTGIILCPPCLIIADKKGYDVVVQILQRNSLHQQITGRVSSSQLTQDGAVGNVGELPLLVNKYNAGEIIFCTNGLSVKKIISLIRHLPAGLIFRFHLAGTVSIVGSQDKGAAGECIA